MRILEQHKQPIFYAKYLGQTEVLDEGRHTGDYDPIYGEIGFAMVYISVPKRDAVVERNGVVTPYRKTLISETDLGLSETDIFMYGLAEYDGDIADLEGHVFNPWEVGENAFGGLLRPWTPNGEVKYKIVRVEPSLHHTTYIIEEL